MADERSCPVCGTELTGEIAQGLCPKCLLKQALENEQDSISDSKTAESSVTGSRFVPPEPAELADCFPKYEIIGLLGSGGMGAVYRARDREMDRLVALKILPPELDQNPGFADRFDREARALAKLNKPNVVHIYDSGRSEDYRFIVMEYVDGRNLRKMMKDRAPEPLEAVEIAIQICRAIQCVHDVGIVHRDIKPENILLDTNGQIKIADFGVVKPSAQIDDSSTLADAGQVVGTKGYWAPEQKSCPDEVDRRADIHSLGIVLYELLTGERPQIPLNSAKHPSKLNKAIDIRLDDVVVQCLSYEPEKRQPSALVLHEQLIDVRNDWVCPQDPVDDLDSFCAEQRRRLRALNSEADWSGRQFTPIDAEVEVRVRRKVVRRVKDLHAYLRRPPCGHLIVMEGDPATGKTSALRHFAVQTLSDEKTSRVGKCPVYIDLSEWKPARQWTPSQPPTAADVEAFVKDHLAKHLRCAAFVEEHFDTLKSEGEFFFLLDSFDEIPALLDVDESHWLVEALSEAIHDFLVGDEKGCGLVASRPFRRPKYDLHQKGIVFLRLREFDDERIQNTLIETPCVSKEHVRILFSERSDLVSVARNALFCTLIGDHIKEDRVLPTNQQRLLHRFIARKLESDSCNARICQAGLTVKRVMDIAADIAWTMFNDHPDEGLRVPLQTIMDRLPSLPVEEVAIILQSAKLARLADGGQRELAFVHRRFHESFVALKLCEQPDLIKLDCIPKDSRWREVLVLVAQVAPTEKAVEIAEYCWLHIEVADAVGFVASKDSYGPALHCLRFLHDAFRLRPECISGFQEELADFVDDKLDGKSILVQKHAVEAAGLLGPERLTITIGTALRNSHGWVKDTAIRACRQLPKLSGDLQSLLISHLSFIPLLPFLRRSRELRFALNLSPALERVRAFCTSRVISSWLLLLAVPLFFLLTPVPAMFALGLVILIAPFAFVLVKVVQGSLATWLSGLIMLFCRIGQLLMVGCLVLVCLPLLVDTLVMETEARARRIRSWANEASHTEAAQDVLDAMRESAEEDVKSVREGARLVAVAKEWVFLQNPPPHGQPWDELFCVAVIIMLVAFCPIHVVATGVARTRLRGPRAKRVLQERWEKLRDFGHKLRVFTKNNTFAFLCLIIAGIGIIVLLAVFQEQVEEIGDVFSRPIETFFEILFGILYGILIGIGLPVAAWWAVKCYTEDRQVLRAATSARTVSRTDIENVLSRLHFPGFRLSYVDWLRDERVEPTGNWTRDMPNYDDSASVLLAQLEERWLRLDR